MKIACLQFNPALGEVKHNIEAAESLLSSIQPGQIDLLVLPELAFTGYNFPSLKAIEPYLEETTKGQTTTWAIQTARRLHCYVFAGYPETWTDANKFYPTQTPMYFNSLVMVSPDGAVVANYRKSFLYYTDETWASEGHLANSPGSASALQNPFFIGKFEAEPGTDGVSLGKFGAGICMDLNPWRFVCPWTDFEFANTMLTHHVRLVVLSMAWLTHRSEEDINAEPDAPDMETIAYWRERLVPFITSKPQEEIIVVFANRCGAEGTAKVASVEGEVNGAEVEKGDRVCYAGSSCVMKFQGGDVRMFSREQGVAILGKAEEGVLVVDTESVSPSSEPMSYARGLLTISHTPASDVRIEIANTMTFCLPDRHRILDNREAARGWAQRGANLMSDMDGTQG